MSKNYLMIDGNKIPISDETAENLRKQYCKKTIPIIRWATYREHHDRMVIELSSRMINRIKAGSKQISVDKFGGVMDNSTINGYNCYVYRDFEPVFGEMEI